MKRRFFIVAVTMLLAACATTTDKDTIATLRNKHVEIKEVKIEGGLEKAMLSYQRFIEESPNSSLTPEAIRRLADLKLEREYGAFTPGAVPSAEEPALSAPEHVTPLAAGTAASAALVPVTPPKVDSVDLTSATPSGQAVANIPSQDESEEDFEQRASQAQSVDSMAAAASTPIEGIGDLERKGTREAIALYEKLLADYPEYERNDQVLYQMSRAYEELGQIEEAMKVMNRMVRDIPGSQYMGEVQFRRAEYFFTRRHYLDAEDAYKSIVDMGDSSQFFELALYKLGWTFYKQELFEEAINRFVALLDHKVLAGYDFEQTDDEQERKRMDDTFRVISLSFSSLGGADSAAEYFATNGQRSYEDKVYSNLGEFYFDKRRYADAAATYNAFVERNQFHKVAPNFSMRVIEIQTAGGFPSLVLDSKKKFASTYGLKAEYWKHFKPSEREDVLGFLKTNLTDLANHYHANYQNPRLVEDKQVNFEEAQHWYREFLNSFPTDVDSPKMNFQFAGLLLENQSFGPAAAEFEKTAYGYPLHEKSSEAGYAAVTTYRQLLDVTAEEDKDKVKREVVRSSIKFADTFPDHEKAAIVLGAAADDLFAMKEYEQALDAAGKLIKVFPNADADVIRDAWLVSGHSAYELERYSEAESAYLNVLALLPEGDESRDALIDNLAASIYKQGEQARDAKDYRAAAEHFLRVSTMAPTSKIRPTAEYDAAAALIELKDWEKAASVLVGFRTNFPDNALQPEVTKKLAYVYRENDQLSLAADEYERIERESQDEEIRRDALLVAGELHEKVGNTTRALDVYRRYLNYFPQPLEPNLETRSKIAEILKAQDDRKSYLHELETIVALDASGGSERTPRTRYLAGEAALVLAEQEFDTFVAVRLVEPFEENLQRKRELMKVAIEKFNQLMDYELGETTAAATFYLAEIYADFSKSLTTSERPKGLSPLEMEQYELAIEDQAYPFEEKAIKVHESNLGLISKGVYNTWIDKSLQKLAKFLPARYDKPEETIVVSSLETYTFAVNRVVPVKSDVAGTEGAEPVAQEEKPAAVEVPEAMAPEQAEEPKAATETEGVTPEQAEEPKAATETESAEPEQAEEPKAATETESAAPEPAEEPKAATETESAEPEQAEEPKAATETESAAPEQAEEPKAATETESAEPEPVEEPKAATETESATPEQAEEPKAATETEGVTPEQAEEPKAATETEGAEPEPDEEPKAATETESAVPEQAEEPKAATETESAEPEQAEEPKAATETESAEPEQAGKTSPTPTGTDQAPGR